MNLFLRREEFKYQYLSAVQKYLKSLLEMEMEMVFNGYSLTGFSITIYNNIIIINTKILIKVATNDNQYNQ